MKSGTDFKLNSNILDHDFHNWKENTGFIELPKKTLIIMNYAEERYLDLFHKKYSNELERDDVILIQNPKNILELTAQIESHRGEFDRVVINTHGSKGKIPLMAISKNDALSITKIVKILNQVSGETLKKIHLSSCFIGFNFDRIEQQDTSSSYYQELNDSLLNDQVLFLHGDIYTSSALDSLSDRLKGIIESKDYSIGDAILDSAEIMSVITKGGRGNLRGGHQLETFSYTSFGRNGEKFSIENLKTHLKDAVERGRAFEKDNKALNRDISHDRLEHFNEEDFKQFLSAIFLTNIVKAIDGDQLEIAKSLIAGGADIDLPDRFGASPLIYASLVGDYDVAKLLIDAKANLDLQNNDGWTALMFASGKGYENIVQILVDAGADLNVRNKDGWTALMFASDNGYENIVQILVDAGANPNLQDVNDWWTALMFASDNGYENIVLALINAGADPNLQNKDGWTALKYAEARGHDQVAKSLGKYINNLELDNKSKQKTPPPSLEKNLEKPISNAVATNTTSNLDQATPEPLMPLVFDTNFTLKLTNSEYSHNHYPPTSSLPLPRNASEIPSSSFIPNGAIFIGAVAVAAATIIECKSFRHKSYHRLLTSKDRAKIV